MKKLVIAILITIFAPSIILAQDISVDELLGNGEDVQGEEITQNVEEEEQERVENIENELNISIPDYTDNPSHIITFRDPSEDNVGVELDIDESGYKDINSPYSLPSLSIGEHRLKFRFVDSIGATKVLEYDIVIIPRPPVLKAPTFQDNDLILSGTGLASSEVVLTVSVGASNYTKIADINSEGNWNTSITLDTVLDGIYTVFAYTRKNGYASNPSEPAVMEYGSEGVVEKSSNSKGLSFDFNDISLNELPSVVSNNPDLLITVISALILGGLIGYSIFALTRAIGSRKKEKEVSEKINGNKPKKEKTLMEMFGEEEKEEKKEDTKKSKKDKKKERKEKRKKKREMKNKKDEIKESNNDEKNVNVNPKEKTFTKRDFLKDFKKFDPDTDSGEEKKEPTKEEKKDLIVTLTSKVD